MTFVFPVYPVMADVPSVIEIKPWTSGSNAILNITVTHASPTGSHYVNKVVIYVDGTVQDVNLEPQSTVNFILQYDLGAITENPTVKVRARCTFHGWSSWSESVVVPEFQLVHLPIIFAILLITGLILRSRKQFVTNLISS